MDTEEDWDELLSPTYPEIRLFNLTGKHLTVMALLLEETDDSFLVALPAYLEKRSDESGKAVGVEVHPYINFPYIRWMKHFVTGITPLFGWFKTAYIKYLKEVALIQYPEYQEYFEEGFVPRPKINEDEELEQHLEAVAEVAGVLSTPRTIH